MTLTLPKKRLYVSRIITGITKFDYKGKFFYIYPANPMDRLMAEELYHETLYNNRFLGMLSIEQMIEHLYDRGEWSVEQEQSFNELPEKIEKYKLDLYNSYFHEKARIRNKKLLNKVRDKFYTLHSIRHAYDGTTCEGSALYAKNYFLMISRIRDETYSPVKNVHQNIVDRGLTKLSSSIFDEESIREIAHTEPWRNIWLAGRTNSVFGKPSTELDEQQLALVSWSRLYDNIYEHPECPPNSLIDDDDLLDGWLIHQNKKQEQAQREKHGKDNLPGGKDHKEVYVPVDSSEDAQRVEGMNDMQARLVKKQRMQVLKYKGNVKEQHMPDSKRQIRTMAMDQYKEHVKNSRKG